MFSVGIWLIVALVGLGLLVAACVAIARMFGESSGGASVGVEVRVGVPQSCALGQPVELEVRIRETMGRGRTVSRVEWSDSFIKGFVVATVNGAPVDAHAAAASSPGLSTTGRCVFDLNSALPANGEVTPRFGGTCIAPGELSGTVKVQIAGDPPGAVEAAVRLLVR